ncbi:MAG TPA: FAD-binding oxidoreductase [Gemmataceae bacterium]|nr:FAD-binding oxidoreductase [Gemmataceae bacterium]
MARKTRWWLLGFALLLLGMGCFVVRPAFHLAKTWWNDKDEVTPPAVGHVDDASRLNETRVAQVWDIPADRTAAEQQLRDLLQWARTRGLRVAIAGARHSMGGHTIYPDGIVLNMLPFNHIHLDTRTGILHVGAGARWSEVLPYLETHGCSVAVMQSNNSFSVGGSVSVNCHGWQHNQPPIASTVQAFRLMKADGTVVRCTRTENDELFRLVLGGYGLFGIILDVELLVVPNERYRLESYIMASKDYVEAFRTIVDPATDIGMVYGRLCIVPGEKDFLREAILNVFRRAPCARDEIPPLGHPGAQTLARTIFRGSVDNDYGKHLRWQAEKELAPRLAREYYARNQLLNEGVEIYQETSAQRTDILHEYFIPPAHFEDFLEQLRVIIPRHKGDLLNVTVRNVHRDNDSFLRYADGEVFGLVMLFNQLRTPEAEARMEAMTRELIDAAIAVGGRHYLPYRLHATPKQLFRSYPQAREFFELKRRHDPQGLFQNQFYRKYGEG